MWVLLGVLRTPGAQAHAEDRKAGGHGHDDEERKGREAREDVVEGRIQDPALALDGEVVRKRQELPEEGGARRHRLERIGKARERKGRRGKADERRDGDRPAERDGREEDGRSQAMAAMSITVAPIQTPTEPAAVQPSTPVRPNTQHRPSTT